MRRPRRAVVIRRTTHSSKPWRLFDADGNHLMFEVEEVKLHSGVQMLDVYGYDTKATAVEALGRLASMYVDKVRSAA